MACIYYYKGHRFNSELELDSFLLTREKYYSKYGDIVFSTNDRYLAERLKLEDLKRLNKQLWDEYQLLRKSGAIKYDPDGDLYVDPTSGQTFRYKGVNSFLAGHYLEGTNIRYFPEFITAEYFRNKEADWKAGNFTDEEKIWLFDGGPTAPIAPADLKTYLDKVKAKWDYQAKAGDAIHLILEIFFSDDDSGNHIRDLSDTDLFNYIKSKLDPENLKALEKNGSPDSNILSGINTAKLIYLDLKTKIGDDNLTFFPEYVLKGIGANNQGNNVNLFGKIDLLVLDSKGKLHVYDYKTSIKNYDLFDTTKKSAYSYLLVTYYQMLENAGISIYGADLNIIPLKINNLEKTSSDTYLFDTVTYGGVLVLDTLATEKAFNLIESIMPAKHSTNITAGNAYLEAVEGTQKFFPKVSLDKLITEKSTLSYLNRNKVFDKRNDNNKYEFSIRTSTNKVKVIQTDTKEEMILAVMNERKNLISSRRRLYERTTAALEEGIEKETTDVSFPRTFANREGSATWILDTLAPYCNKEWEIIKVPDFEEFGIIVLRNKNTKQYDFIGISVNDLYLNFHEFLPSDDPNKSRKNLLGLFETDALAELKYKKLTLEGLMGNVELIQMMLAINGSLGFENGIIGNMLVINPYDALMITASNELLLVNYNALCKHAGITNNKYDSGELKLAHYFDLLENMLTNIWVLGDSNNWEDRELRKYRDNLSSCKSDISKAKLGDISEKIKAVLNLLIKLRTDMNDNNELSQDYTELSRLQSRKIKLYHTVLFAYAELKGIYFRQLTLDGHKWFSTIYKALKEGLSGNMIDNPGNLDSDTLNLITTLVKEAYQNTRDDVLREKAELDKILDKLKKDIGFSYLKENIGYNQAALYKPLYREVEFNGVKDLWFKKVEEVPAEYRPLLEFMLDKINRRRWAERTDLRLLQMKDNYDPEYYRVPLARGDLSSKAAMKSGLDNTDSMRGLFKTFKENLKYLNPKNWKEMYDKGLLYIQGLGYKEKRAEKRLELNLIYELENYFDRGENQRELALTDLSEGKSAGHELDDVEINAEKLMLKHIFAYSLAENVNAVFPLIQAAAAHISIQGANANTTFSADKLYLEEYIRSKVKKESIISPLFLGTARVLNIIKRAASMMTLSFTPVQMLYLPLQGLWVDISLAIRKPDGSLAFTFTNFKNSLKLVYGDLFNFSGKPTLCSLLNEYYALNDMDINKYVDAISKTKKGLIYNFSGMAFKFASRPDFYNRLAIFLSQMLGDGTLEAHSVVNGELKYDWTKDKRFSKFAADPTNKTSTDPEYIKQRSLYYAMATLFVNERAKNPDGSDFVLDMDDPKPLPRAYTSKLAEGYKSVADDIYGYYSEENKSLVQATALGSMWLQFKTYWSGKKNQYLQSGGIRMRGSWENYTEIEKNSEGIPVLDENGRPKIIEYYYDIKNDGSVDYTKIVKKEDLPPNKLLAPVTYWKGLWQEGIALTLTKLCLDRHIIRNYHKLMLEDPDMARCYKSNILQLGVDMFLFLIGGCLLGGILSKWLKELLAENKDNADFLTGCGLAAANVAVWTVKNSFLDFNFFNSIGGPLAEWTPFAVTFTKNTVNNLGKFAVGDLDLWDTIVRTNGPMKLIKPIFDAIKPEMYRTPAEGGTWQSGFGGGSTGGGGASSNW